MASHLLPRRQVSLASLARSFVITLGLMVGFIAPLQAGPTLYDSGNGLTATADFSVTGTTLRVLLSNTSVPPFGGQNGSANMILSSLSFDLPAGVTILGGTAVLGPESTVVTSTTGTGWSSFAGPVDLNYQYGFSNEGVGHSGGRVILSATNTVTSHSDGRHEVVAFSGSGLANNGLEWGLVPTSSLDHGHNQIFVRNSVLFTLHLSAPLQDTSFLTSGSYVEFGSGSLYVPADERTRVPEPASLALVGTGVLLLGASLRKRRRQTA